MKLHPLLNHPDAVLISRFKLTQPPDWDTFRQAALQVMQEAAIELEGERALIKPNATSGEHFADPDNGVGTHPGFVHGMIDYLRTKGVPTRRIVIGEDPRDSDDNNPRHWRGTGYDRITQETGVRLYCPTTYSCVKVEVPDPHTFPVLNVSRLAVSPKTVLFNVPKMKTHNLGITTLGMKNLMGLVNVFDRHYCGQAWSEMPPEIRDETRPRTEWFSSEMHELWQAGLARRLVDTAQVLRPAFNLVEGVVAREGTGFQRGRNRFLGLMIAGVNVVAVDSLASYLMGFDPLQTVYLKMAAEAGLGENDVSRLKVYLVEDGELTPCPDIEALRARPRMYVIRNIIDEDQTLFQNAQEVVDFTSIPPAEYNFAEK